MPDLAIASLDDLTTLSVRGSDAVPFLQGQLSQDVEALGTQGALLAGLHNPQGRCLAVLRLLHLNAEHLLLVLPAELAQAVRQQLSRYVLRAKVKIEDAADVWRVYGVTGPDSAAAASTRLHMSMGVDDLRHVIVAPRGEPLPEGDHVERDAWRLDDIAGGIPEILKATSGLWVSQMLNLDLLGAISFSKGCYTGQEVIARAHYRGQVKRRMQRFFTESEMPLMPGERVTLTDGRQAQIVMAALMPDGGQEFLAVTPTLTQLPTTDDPADNSTATLFVDCSALPLPYSFVSSTGVSSSDC
jgi:folate-binding protein YgfZ